MNWMSIKPIAGPQASNDTKRLASTRARRSSKTTNCQLQVHIPASTAKDRLASKSLNLRAFWVPERRAAAFFPKPASTRRDQLPIIRPHRQKSTPDKPHHICCQSAAAPHPGSHVAKLNEKAFQRSRLQWSNLRQSQIASFSWATATPKARASSRGCRGQEDTG